MTEEMVHLKLDIRGSAYPDKETKLLNKLAEVLDRKISLEDWAKIEKIILKGFKNEKD